MQLKKFIKIFFADIYIDFLLMSLFFLYVFYTINMTLYYFICISFTLINIILWVISRVQLGNSFSVTAQAKQLVSNGIYSKIRNPMYVFSFLSLVGMVAYLNSMPGYCLLLILLIVQVRRSEKESAALKAKFGELYADYREKTWF